MTVKDLSPTLRRRLNRNFKRQFKHSFMVMAIVDYLVTLINETKDFGLQCRMQSLKSALLEEHMEWSK